MHKRDVLLKSLGAELARHPGAGMSELAERIGVSRGTLYRLAPSREGLMTLLEEASVEAAKRALEMADVANGAPLEALRKVTFYFLNDVESYGFWMSEIRLRSSDNALIASDESWDFYNKDMLALFNRGQSIGVFRSDMPSSWLLKSYDFQLMAASSALLVGTLARASATDLVLQTLLKGIEPAA